MSTPDIKKAQPRAAWTRLISTVPRCHVLGSIISVALIICVAWVWSRSQAQISNVPVGDVVVDLNEAEALIENADQWRQLSIVNSRRSESTDQRAQRIAAWLPDSVDWPRTEEDIRSISEAAQLSMLSIQQDGRHLGARVGVVAATCEVTGTYAALCRFLSDLSMRPQPIACSEIQLHRIGDHAGNQGQTESQQCRATLTLRIPFAASGTAAGQLRSLENENAS